MTPEDKKFCEEVENRCQKATPGPWKHEHGTVPLADTGDYEHFDALKAPLNRPLPLTICDDWGGHETACDNFNFIAHARMDIPRLLSIIKEQEPKPTPTYTDADVQELVNVLSKMKPLNIHWDQYDHALDKAESVGALKMLKNAEAVIGRHYIEFYGELQAALAKFRKEK